MMTFVHLRHCCLSLPPGRALDCSVRCTSAHDHCTSRAYTAAYRSCRVRRYVVRFALLCHFGSEASSESHVDSLIVVLLGVIKSMVQACKHACENVRLQRNATLQRYCNAHILTPSKILLESGVAFRRP